MSTNHIARRLFSGVRSRTRGRTRLGDTGQALVEMAIALPILLALLVGIFEFARAYNVQQVITNAAREGAREGVVSGQAAATPVVNLRLTEANISGQTVTVTCVPAACANGDALTVEVSVSYTFVFIGPVLSLFSSGVDPGTITLASTSTMRVE
ncbi:MAG: pilus assembly protein [Gemmatimonadetes bacterium]|nr:pilus assembly protein [Gemmatimonadota bacterium]